MCSSFGRCFCGSPRCGYGNSTQTGSLCRAVLYVILPFRRLVKIVSAVKRNRAPMRRHVQKRLETIGQHANRDGPFVFETVFFKTKIFNNRAPYGVTALVFFLILLFKSKKRTDRMTPRRVADADRC